MRRHGCALKLLKKKIKSRRKLKLGMKFPRMAGFVYFHLQSNKSESCVLINLDLSPLCHLKTQNLCGVPSPSSFLVWVLLAREPRARAHAAHKESILAARGPRRPVGPCRLLLRGNWQPLVSCKQQLDVSPCSSDSRPTLETRCGQNRGGPVTGFDPL